MKNPIEMIEISHQIIEVFSFRQFLKWKFPFLRITQIVKFIIVGENRSDCVRYHIIKNKKKDFAVCVEYFR